MFVLFNGIVLLSVFCLVHGKKEDSVFFPFEQKYSESIGFAVDERTKDINVIHTYEVNEGDELGSVFYTKFNQNLEKVLPPTPIDSAHKTKKAKIMTLEDSDHLLIVEEAKRKPSGIVCHEHDISGCSDIFFVETEDGGKSWKDPIQLPRENMTDSIARYGFSSIYIKETGRIYVFYLCVLGVNNFAFGYVSRSKGSSLFSSEKFFFQKRNLRGYHSFSTYTWDANKAIIHLFWCESNGPVLMYSNSVDVFKDWSDPVMLDKTYDRSEEGPSVSVIAKTDISSSSIYVSYYKDPLSGTLLIYSNNHGKTWSQAMGLPYSTPAIPSQTICGKKEEPYIFMVGLASGSNICFGYYNVTGKRFHKLVSPGLKANEESVPYINCNTAESSNIYSINFLATWLEMPTTVLLKLAHTFNK